MESTAVPIGNGSILVAVVAAGSNPSGPVVKQGDRLIPAKVIGHDPVSRLEFIKTGGIAAPNPIEWNQEVGGNSNAVLRTMESDGNINCQTTGWVKQVGGKVLPLALLGVNFSRAVPPPGTPLVDGKGRVVAIVFQGSGKGNSGYAIPAEAVHRVRKDLTGRGELIRGWLGLGLRLEARLPQISSVVADSPAAQSGIRVNDVLMGIGSRQIADYADAANAFFYLVPGEPVRIKLRRNSEQLELTLTPTEPRS